VGEDSGPRPVFVYGTLRQGQPNWGRLLAGRVERVVAGRLGDVVLLDCGHYPAAAEQGGGGGAVGEVVWVRPADWAFVLAALDHLEGYDPRDPDPLYERVVRPVETDDGPVDCWVYLAGRALVEAGRPSVAGGDWAVHCAELPQYRQHWEGIVEAGGRAARPGSGPTRARGAGP
jgi:gamma-glutamylcyclotransferase (GGCT)/AIG2-like uncharacterized protein YtfP